MDSISKFDINELRDIDFSMLVCSKRRTGKTVIVTDFLYHMRDWFDEVHLFSETSGLQTVYECIDKRFSYNEINEKLLKGVWDLQNNRLKKEIARGVPRDKQTKILVIFDDVLSDVQKIRTKIPTLNQFATQGRHARISYIAISQYYTGFSPIIRSNSDVIICFYLSREIDRDTLIKEFLSIKNGRDNKRIAADLFNEIIQKDYRALVIKNYVSSSREYSDIMTHYTAQPKMPDFKVFKLFTEAKLTFSESRLDSGIKLFHPSK